MCHCFVAPTIARREVITQRVGHRIAVLVRGRISCDLSSLAREEPTGLLLSLCERKGIHAVGILRIICWAERLIMPHAALVSVFAYPSAPTNADAAVA